MWRAFLFDEPELDQLLEVVRDAAKLIDELRAGRNELVPSTLALFNRLLLHPNRDVKGPVLRSAPSDAALTEGMRHVAAEKWAWQEKTARKWLDDRR